MILVMPNTSVADVLRQDLRHLVAQIDATVDPAAFTRMCRLRIARTARRAATECPICLDPLGPKYRRVHACGHLFHDACIGSGSSAAARRPAPCAAATSANFSCRPLSKQGILNGAAGAL